MPCQLFPDVRASPARDGGAREATGDAVRDLIGILLSWRSSPMSCLFSILAFPTGLQAPPARDASLQRLFQGDGAFDVFLERVDLNPSSTCTVPVPPSSCSRYSCVALVLF